MIGAITIIQNNDKYILFYGNFELILDNKKQLLKAIELIVDGWYD